MTSGKEYIEPCKTQDQARGSAVGTLNLRSQTTRELTLGSIKQQELPQRKLLEYKTNQHPTTSRTLCTILHPNNKQNKNTNPIISREDYHLTQLCPSEEKNNSALISPYTKLTQTPESNLGGQKPKGKNNSTLKSGKRRPQPKKKKEEEEGRRKKEEGRRRRRRREILHK